MESRTAAILIVGNEVLSGKVEDANSPFLCRELRALGVSVERILTLPDVVEIIAAEVPPLAARYDWVFTAGGIGPTHDDVTIEGIARGFGVRVVLHEELADRLREHYGARLTSAHLKMASIPAGAELVGGPALAFPVVAFRNVYIFPGVPSILRQKFAAIRETFRQPPFYLATLEVDLDEGLLAGHLSALLSQFPGLSVGSYPQFPPAGYQVKVTLESKDPAVLAAAQEALRQRLPAGALVGGPGKPVTPGSPPGRR
jgi:molybdenum cofactor synthesis domain-containing protein